MNSGMAFVHSKKPCAAEPRAWTIRSGMPLVIEVRDLLAKDEVLEEGRPAKAGLQRTLIVRDGNALVGREHTVGGVNAHPIERTDCRILANVRPTAADLVGAVDLADCTGANNRISGLDGAALGRRECRLGIVFGLLVWIEGKRGRDVLRSRRLLGEDVTGA